MDPRGAGAVDVEQQALELARARNARGRTDCRGVAQSFVSSAASVYFLLGSGSSFFRSTLPSDCRSGDCGLRKASQSSSITSSQSVALNCASAALAAAAKRRATWTTHSISRLLAKNQSLREP